MSPDATPWISGDNESPYRPGAPTCPRPGCRERPALTATGWACPCGAAEYEMPRGAERALRELAEAQAHVDRLQKAAARWKKLAIKLRQQRDEAVAMHHEVVGRVNQLDFQGMVSDFHDAFGVPVRHTPTVPPDDEVRLRARLMTEEDIETLDGMFPGCHWPEIANMIRDAIQFHTPHVDIVNLANELADKAYVLFGTACQFGIDLAPVFQVIHAANMAKVGGVKDETGKVRKPPGWHPADVAAVLRAQGWANDQEAAE